MPCQLRGTLLATNLPPNCLAAHRNVKPQVFAQVLQHQDEELQRIFLEPATRQCVFGAHTHAPTIHEQDAPAAQPAKIILRGLRCFVQTPMQTLWNQGAKSFTHG